MKIATKLRIGYIFSAFIIITAGVFIYLSHRQMDLEIEKLRVTDRIIQGVFELNILGSEFLLYREDRPKIQWQTRYDALNKLLIEEKLKEQKNAELFSKITEDLIQLNSLFSELLSIYPLSRGEVESRLIMQLQNRLQSQLQLKSQKLFLNSSELKKQIEDELSSLQYFNNWMSLTLIIASALFSAAIGFLIGRNISIPIKTLVRGTEKIGSGDLNVSLATERNDELGQLSRSFDEMINKLKISMVSRDNLESIVDDRTAELADTNKQLALEIEERILADEKTKAAEIKYRTVADYTYDWEYWQNSDGKIEYMSPSCLRISGYSVQEFKTNPSLLIDIILPEDRNTWHSHTLKVHSGMKLELIQFRIQRKDGEIRWIEHICQSVSGKEGIEQGIRASNRDITKTKQYESEKQQLQSELAHADRIVTIGALSSALAHEINQPLAAMRSYAQAALRFLDADQPDYDSVRKGLQGIVDDNKRASSVVNRLRALVKKEPPHEEIFEINLMIEEAVALIRNEADLRNSAVKLDLQGDNLMLRGDSVQIQQVIINLLTNALDAMDDTPIGARHVTVSTKVVESDVLTVSVSDSGDGIDQDKIKSIFEPFYSSKPKGIGLGLAICQSIIESHGGRLEAENNSGGGVTFSFTLPFDKELLSNSRKEVQKPQEPLR